METMTQFSSLQEQDFISPITLERCLGPVLASDGHIYERTAIIRWIEQQGQSPLTREVLNVNDLFPEVIASPDQRDSTNNSRHNSRASLANLLTVGPIEKSSDTETCFDQCLSCKEKTLTKKILVITMTSGYFLCPVIIFGLIVLFVLQPNAIQSSPTGTDFDPMNGTFSPTIYKFPNNCTESNIIPLFSWSNSPAFNYSYYSKIYTAISTRSTLTFAFRHDLSYWCIDDISMKEMKSNRELVANGNFETNPLNEFGRCNADGSISSLSVVASLYPHTGNQSFCVRTVSAPIYLSQRLSTQIGQIYHVSFWLKNFRGGPNGLMVVMSS